MSTPAPFRRRLLLNSATSGLANVWTMALTLATLPLFLDAFGTERFGAWALLLTCSATTGWLSLLDLGLATATSRQVATHLGRGDEAAARRAAGSGLAAFVTLALVIGGATTILGPAVLPPLLGVEGALGDELARAIRGFGLWVSADFVFAGLAALLDGWQRLDLARLSDMARRAAVLGTAVVIARSDAVLDRVTVGAGVAATLAVIIPSIAVSHTLGWSGLRVSFVELRAIIRYSRAVAALRSLGVIHRTMDRVIVSQLFGPTAVALVEIAAQLQAGADAILGASTAAVVPASAYLDADGRRDALRHLILTGSRYVVLLTIPVVLGTQFLAEPLIELWLGTDHIEAALLTTVAVGAIGLAAPIAVSSNLLLGTARVASLVRAAALSLALNLGLTLLLVDRVGIIGAFWATVAATGVLYPALLRGVLADHAVAFGEFLREAVAPTVPPAAGLVVVLSVVRLASLPPLTSLVIGAFVGGGVYVAIAFRWSFRPDELRDLRHAITTQ